MPEAILAPRGDKNAEAGATKNPGAQAPGFVSFARISRDQKLRVM